MTPTPRIILEDVAARIALHRAPLDVVNDSADRHRGFLIWRRAEAIAVEPGNADMTEGMLATRVFNEQKLIDDHVTRTVAALCGGADVTPPHLDLSDLAKPTVTTAPNVAAHRAAVARRSRARRVRAIAWRAAAIHAELWKPSADRLSATLDTSALDELIDRRLRIVERMNYQMGDAQQLGGGWIFTGRGAHGPWTDAFRTRPFELPEIPRHAITATKQVLQFIGGEDHVADENRDSFLPGDPEWRWAPNRSTLLYNGAPFRPGTHMSGMWALDATEPQFVEFVATSGTLGTAIDLLFQPEADWWSRSWLPGPMHMAALHLDALLFARRRRLPASGQTEFDALVTAHPQGYVAIGDFLGGTVALGKDRLIKGGASDPHFESAWTPTENLQVGDHVEIVNNAISSEIFVDGGPMHALIVDLDSDLVGGIDRKSIRLQGLGTRESSHENFIVEYLASRIDASLAQARTVVGDNPTATTLDWHGRQGVLVRWEPYEAFPDPGAWWFRVDPSLFPNSEKTLAMFRGAVADDPNPGAGYTPPKFTDSVYFPLFRPKFPDWWTGYFDSRRVDPKVRVELEPYKTDGMVIQGLFFLESIAGRAAQALLIRPRVTLTP